MLPLSFQPLDFRRLASSALSETKKGTGGDALCVLAFQYSRDGIPSRKNHQTETEGLEGAGEMVHSSPAALEVLQGRTRMTPPQPYERRWLATDRLVTHYCHICRPCKSIWQLILGRAWRARNEETPPTSPMCTDRIRPNVKVKQHIYN